MTRIQRLMVAVAATVGLIGVGSAVVPAQAQGVTVPPLCIRVPLGNGLQIQVGYCP